MTRISNGQERIEPHDDLWSGSVQTDLFEVFNSVPLDFTDSVKYKLYGCSEWGPRVPRQNLVKSPQVAFPASPGSCFA